MNDGRILQDARPPSAVEAGVRLGVIPTPHLVSTCAFDATETRLFLTGDADLWMVELA